jgi:hypothetical protein
MSFTEIRDTIVTPGEVLDTFGLIYRYQNSRAAEVFAYENLDFLDSVCLEYNRIGELLRNLSPAERAVMPYTQEFLDRLGLGNNPYSFRPVNSNPQAARADLARMLANGESPLPTPNQDHAILFGTRVKSPQAYLTGLAGHLAERGVVNGFPGRNWRKDHLLHAVDEGVLLAQIRGLETDLLHQYFTLPIEEGGLGWISPEIEDEFNKTVTTSTIVDLVSRLDLGH